MLLQVRLEKGLYVIFLADWFRVFPRKQIHVIRFEDYITDIAGHLKRMFEFLDLGETSLLCFISCVCDLAHCNLVQFCW